MRDNVEAMYPLSPLQKGILFHTQYAPGESAYLSQNSYVLEGTLNVEALKSALHVVVNRHTALRTAFVFGQDGEPVQLVAKQVKVPFETYDLKFLPESEQNARLARYFEEENCRGCDLSSAPLMRVALFHLNATKHKIIWNIHHIIVDGWSMPIILKEVFAHYAAHCQSRELRLKEPQPYKHYIDWLQQQDLKKAEAYWRQTLAGITAPTSPRFPRSSPENGNGAGHTAICERKLSPELSNKLRAFCREQFLTPGTVAHGVWAILLSRYSNQRSVLFGSVVSGRPPALRDVGNMVGLFVNSLPLRVDVDSEKPVNVWLRELQEQQADMREYSYSDLSEVQRWSEIASPQPLFETMLIFENYPLKAALEADSGSAPVSSQNAGIKLVHADGFDRPAYPLCVAVAPGQGFSLLGVYDPRRFDRIAIERVLGHFENLCEAISQSPQQRIWELRLLSKQEERDAVVSWNDTKRKFPREQSVSELFERQVELRPDDIAVVCGRAELKYGELNARANQLAHYLRKRRVGPEVIVGLCLERSLDMVVGLLAILKAGGAYLPLDPDYPQQRLEYMLADARVSLILTERRLIDSLPVSLAQTIALDEEWSAIAKESAANPSCETGAGNLAYVNYTSGSTGQPKGIGIPHRAISRLVLQTDYVQLAPADRVAQASTVSFDAATFEIWGALLNGARLAIVPKDIALSPRVFARVLREQEISALFLTTALFNRLAQENGESLASVKHVLFGGEAVDPRWVRAVLEQGAPQRLLHVYGPTESTTFATWEPVESVDKNATTVPIGKAIANTAVFVMDQWFRPVPVGLTGEICIAGDGLARGYINDAELTAQRFVPHPYSGGERLYRTGDEGRYLEDGRVEYLGRRDQQVKVRGYRIELGEIEAVLESHGSVRQAVVTVREEGEGDQRLVGYVVTAEGLENEREIAAELKSYLRERLPEYMVPQQWVVLEQMPLTANGKVDRRSLPAPSSVRQLDHEEEGEWTPVEELVAGIWSEVLKVAAVGREENFFELGGHSLLATQVISRVREVFGVEVELRRLFAEPTVSGLSRSVEEQLRAGERVTVPPLVRAEREQWNGLLPLSFAQQRLWFLDQLAPGDTSYNMPMAVRLRGELDVAALECVLSEIVRRHEVLRTRFVVVGGEPRQEVCEAVAVQLPLTDLSELDEAARVAAVREAALGEGRQPFDLAQGPVLRVQLLRLSAQEHVVLLTLHHIVSDGWSRGLLIKEVATLYEAYSKGEASPLPELKVQYADFAVWQRGWLQGEALERQLGYWREQLSGELAVLEMPTDHPRPAVAGNRGAQQRFELGSETTARLRELSRREGVTLFMTLLAAFQTLLYRYSGQADVVVGSPVAGRNYRATESLLGFFVNTLPLRVQLSGELEFVELLRRVKEVCLGAYAHQDVPFEKLVEELQPRREASRSPIYQAVLTLQNAPRAELQLSGLRLQGVASGEGTGKYELNFSLSESGRGLEGFLEYHAELYEAETIRKLLGDYQRLLERVVADPAAQVGRLRFLSAAEEQEVLVERNQTQRAYHSEGGLRQWLTAVAAKYREQAAVVCGSEQLSYGELDQRSNQLAHYLRRQGVRSGVVVGLCLEQSVELVVGLLGIVKAGGTYLPLDPGYPRQRMEYVLREAQVQLVLTQERLRWPAEWQWLALDQLADEEWATIAQESEAALSFESEPGALVYVMYTSGTTGQPKGVAIGEAALLNYLQWALEQYVRGERLSFGVCTSIGFDLTVTSIYLPLLSGGRLVLYQPGAEAVAAALRENQVEVLKLTPSHLLQLAGGEHGGSRLRRLIVGGEALSVQLAERVVSSFGGELELYNEYGPTEATVGCMVHRYEAGGESGPGVSIGRAAANTEIYVLDEGLEPVGENVVGEIYIGGAGLARGYWQAVAQTAAKFVPHPYSRVGGARLYRSGDLGRWRRDGRLEYLGRRDEQVKYQGHRVELQELRAALNEHPEVRESVVRLERDGEASTGVLVAYYVSRHELAASELRSWLSERVIKETVPSVYVHLKRLPLGLNGKVNYEALPGLSEWRRQREQASGAAAAGEWTPVEELVAGIWSELLKITRMGREENFFELGGHSLLATQVISRVREVFGVEVGLRRLFEEPTVRGLGRSIEAQLRVGGGLTVPPLVRAEREQWGDLLPLSFAQQRLWFLDQLEPGSGFYNVPVAVRLKGKLVVAALEQTLTEIVRRHEVLRTRFVSVAGEPRQEVLGAEAIQLQIQDLSELAEAAREAAVKEAAAGEARDPFDLAHGPLLRVKLLRLGEQEHVVLLTMHHIASDGWTMELLIKEVATLYEAYSQNKLSPLPELPIQYGDFAVWQRGWLQGEELERQMAYWREQLSGELPVLELPTDRPRPAVQSHRGEQLVFRLNPELSAGLKELSRREGVTLFMTMLAAFQTLLHRHNGQNDIVVGTDIAGRNYKETEALMGFFVNQLVLRTDLSGEPAFVELLQRVKKTCLAAYAHQDVPFEKLVEELQPKRDLSLSPLFQVKLVFLQAPQQERRLSALQLSHTGGVSAAARFDLLLGLEERGGELHGSLKYNTDLFDSERIERLLRRFEVLLQGIVVNPERRLCELPLLPEEETRTIQGWSESRIEYGPLSSVHELFEAQVERDPAALAVVCGSEQLSYGELNQRANQLAHYLRKQGVGAEVVVGLCVERSVELVVGLLGILKAGGAYLPLDARYPRSRLAYMLAETEVQVLLTEQRLIEQLPMFGERAIALDQQWEAIAIESGANLEVKSAAENLAYVIFTSGSTGQPKGVMISHGNLVQLWRGLQQAVYAGLEQEQLRVGWNASLGFDASVKQWLQLLSGHTLYLLGEEERLDSERVLASVREQRLQVLDTTPGQLRTWLAAGLGAAADQEELAAVLVGGEALEGELWRELSAQREDGGAVYYNVYGPTECTVDATCAVVSGERAVLGRPLEHVSVYVLNEQQELAGVGVRGELCLGGGGVGRGYWQQAALTAERFVPHPYSASGGERLYRTGDEGRYLEDGRIEYLGRRDQQVKLRGYRIELGEIEVVLESHAGVRQAVVTLHDERLVGYVVAEVFGPGHEAAAELRDFLRERLPEYMVPQQWVMLERMPLTANGKVDRQALPAPTASSALLQEGEWTPVEELLAGIWSEVLNVQAVGRDDNFFELGGHSLLATQMVSRAREVFGVRVSLRRLFKEPTVRALSRSIEEELKAGEGLKLPALQRLGIKEREQWGGLLPLSFAQQRLWFLNQLEPESAFYNVPMSVRLRGELDVAALERTLSEIVRRHEVLRTRFVMVGGEPRQEVLDAAKLKLAVTDLSGFAESEREAAVKEAAKVESRKPFDLVHGPLLRVKLLRVSDKEHVILLTMHHIVSDGWSLGVLIKEVATLYEAYRKGEESPLPELSLQYSDFAVWQRSWLQGEELDQQLEHWRRQLGGALPVLELPADRPHPAVPSYRGAQQAFQLSPELSAGLKELSLREGVTLFMTLLAAFETLLYRYSGQPRIIVGSPIANRNLFQTENLIGIFINQLVFSCNPGKNPLFRDFLKAVKDSCLGAYAHQDLPFEKLIEELEPERSASHSPLFQVEFGIQNAPLPEAKLTSLKLEPVNVENETSRYDLTLWMSEGNGQLSGAWTYNTDIFDAPTITKMAKHFNVLLESIIRNPATRLTNLEMLTEEEKTETKRRAAHAEENALKRLRATRENSAAI